MSNIKQPKKEAEIEFIEKKSKFIGFSAPVENEEEALNIIKNKRKTFYDATHNVYAYVTEKDNRSRFSDDGEPQGTAGLPVLNAIKMSGLTNIVVVVTRYFGGILLGAGGLVRAYSTAASMAISESGTAELTDYSVYLIHLTYSEYKKVSSLLNSDGVIIDFTDFSNEVDIQVAVCRTAEEKFLQNINLFLNGKNVCKFKENRKDFI